MRPRPHPAGDTTGLASLRVGPEEPVTDDAVIRGRFDEVAAELESPNDTSQPKQELFSGQGLRARLHVAEVDPNTTSTATKAEDLAAEVMLQFHLDLPAMTVADISAYNRLLPPTWDIALLGGVGSVNGRLTATDEQLTLNLNLAADDVDLQLGNDRANADLLLALHVAIPGNAEAASDQGFGPLLAAADGKVSAAIEVSDLDWIAELLDRPLGLRIAGTGAVDAQIVLKDGLPSVGSEVRIPPRELAVSFLDYRIEGK